jgi:hypothetical protein
MVRPRAPPQSSGRLHCAGGMQARRLHHKLFLDIRKVLRFRFYDGLSPAFYRTAEKQDDRE